MNTFNEFNNKYILSYIITWLKMMIKLLLFINLFIYVHSYSIIQFKEKYLLDMRKFNSSNTETNDLKHEYKNDLLEYILSESVQSTTTPSSSHPT